MMNLRDLTTADLKTVWLMYQAEKGGAEPPSISTRRVHDMEEQCLVDYRVTLSEAARKAIEKYTQTYHPITAFDILERQPLARMAFCGAAPPYNATLYEGKVEATVFEGGITVFLDPPTRRIEFQVEQRGDEFESVCARASDWVRYPQHAQLWERQNEVGAVTNFIAWLKRNTDVTERNVASIVAEYFGVNREKLREEKRVMEENGRHSGVPDMLVNA